MLDPEKIEQVLIECACEGKDISYSELLSRLGLRFSRPKVHQLCRVLGEISEDSVARGDPCLAVLVVRSSDRLPGHGWWESRTSYRGDWTGDRAAAYVHRLQRKVFQYWQNRSKQGA